MLSLDARLAELRAGGASDCTRARGKGAIRSCSRIIGSRRLLGRRIGKKNLAVAHYNRGCAYADKGDLDQAIADYTQAIRLYPKFARAYNNRGDALSDIGDYERAIADFTQAIRLNPALPQAYLNRGFAGRILGDYGQSAADYTRAIRLTPNYTDDYYAGAYSGRGYAYLRSGRIEKALADFRIAVELAPGDGSIRYSLAEGLYIAGRRKQAAAAWNEACRLAPRRTIRDWQRKLAEAGHYTRALDGICGARTLQAFRSCARAHCKF